MYKLECNDIPLPPTVLATATQQRKPERGILRVARRCFGLRNRDTFEQFRMIGGPAIPRVAGPISYLCWV